MGNIITKFKQTKEYNLGWGIKAREGEVVAISSTSGSGKTSLALTMMNNTKVDCLFISLEMSKEEIDKKIVKMFDSYEHFTTVFSSTNWETISEKILESDARVIFIDYFNLIDGNKKIVMDDLEHMFPGKTFIVITQKNKDGSVKGGCDLTQGCTQVINMIANAEVWGSVARYVSVIKDRFNSSPIGKIILCQNSKGVYYETHTLDSWKEYPSLWIDGRTHRGGRR